MTLWFTSDTHYNHANIIEYVKRPFRDVEHMNEEIIQRYNSVVQEEDLVLFLGDVFFSDKAWAAAAMQRLKGQKSLVMGNHDRMSVSKFKSMGFVEVYRKYTLCQIAGRDCFMQHYPVEPPPGTEYTLHGHTHTRNKRAGKLIHVGVDAWDYYPVSEDDVRKLMEDYESTEVRPQEGG